MRSPPTPNRCMPITATLIAVGMPSTITSAPRSEPSITTSTKVTTAAPSARLLATVDSVRSTKAARS